MKGLADDEDAEYWDISSYEYPAKITFHDWKQRSQEEIDELGVDDQLRFSETDNKERLLWDEEINDCLKDYNPN